VTAIALTGLTKRFGTQIAVNELNLTVDRGVLFGFLGPNGAGKTTTIRMMLGLVRPTAGTIRLLEQPVWEPRRAVLSRVGAIVEDPAFWPYLSGRRNLEYLARAAGPSAEQHRRLGRIEEVLRQVDLQEAAGKKVKAYSHGMRQRLGIAATLLGEPDIIVLDEPLNGLDPQGIREMRSLLRRLADGGATVFISSHLLSEVELTCDRVAVLARGRLVAEGAPSSLRGDVVAVAVEVDDEGKARKALAKLTGATLDGSPGDATLRVVLGDALTPAAVNAALVKAGVSVAALIPERSSLEDAFLTLVADAETPQ
jgi:ABC-2 type transport system ATP-binding protein